MQIALDDRRSDVLKAASSQLDWDHIKVLTVDPRSTLAEAVTKFLADAKTLEDSIDAKAKAAMVTEQAELDARRRLGELKAAVLEAIVKQEHCAKLQACIDGLSPATISRKSTDLSKTMAAQEVADALNAELKELKVHELQVVMKPASPGGKTQIKLALQLPGGGAPSAILSDGEQRAIAIASFMTEVKPAKALEASFLMTRFHPSIINADGKLQNGSR